MIKKLLAILSAAGAFFSAVFYVLYKQAKDERKIAELEAEKKQAEEKAAATEAVNKANEKIAESIAKGEKESEELRQKINESNNLNSFNAGLELLRQQSEKGRKRNNSPDA
jgi:hypothetical protein